MYHQVRAPKLVNSVWLNLAFARKLFVVEKCCDCGEFVASQVVETRTKIASHPSAFKKRELNFPHKLQVGLANEMILSMNKELRTHFMKTWNGRNLRVASAVFGHRIGLTTWSRDLSVYNENRSVSLNKKVGLGVVSVCLFRPNAYIYAGTTAVLKP